MDALLITQKDFIKFPSRARQKFRVVVPILELEFLEGAQEFMDRVRATID